MAVEITSSTKFRLLPAIPTVVPVALAIAAFALPMPSVAFAQGTKAKFEAAAVSPDSIVRLARKQLGKRYVFGGTKPEIGFDCSGLLQYLAQAFKIDIPRNSAAQGRIGEPVPRDMSKLKVGDLLTFGHRGKVSHIGIYTGNGKFVHASTGSRRVVESLLDRKPSGRVKPWIGARRLPAVSRALALAASSEASSDDPFVVDERTGQRKIQPRQ